jgi:predicted permease
MSDNLTTVVPIALFFVLGVGLARFGLATSRDGEFLLRFIFFVALPALVLVTVSGADLPAEKVLLPVGAALVALAGLAAAWVYGSRRGLPPNRLGAVALSAMILNTAFCIPFILAGYGEEGLTDLVLFDIGNAFMVTLVAYPLAYRFGGQDAHLRAAFRRAISSPLTWALPAALILNASKTELPRVLHGFFAPLGSLIGPLILIALGILFTPSRQHLDLVTTTVALRMLGGLLAGAALAALFGFSGDTRLVVLIGAASPIGFTALTFSSLASLDVDVSARAISGSLLIGIIAVPLAVALTSHLG